MGLINVGTLASNGDTANATDISTPINIIVNDYNGNIDNDNIKSSAAIVDTKLAQITTANKVSTTAITGTYNNIQAVTITSTTLISTTITAGNITSVTLTATNITISGSINSITDYSATSVITGWSDITTKQLYFSKIGKKVFVSVYFSGTSNGTTVSFTVPYISAGTPEANTACLYTQDKGTATTTGGEALLGKSSTITNVYADMAGATWSNSGTKIVVGQFTYDEA